MNEIIKKKLQDTTKIQPCDLKDLHFRNYNPRYPGIFDDENDMINEILTSDHNKLADSTYNLAKDISKKGLSTPDLPVVAKDEKKFLRIYDGNRRLAAIKGLHDPSLIKDESTRKKFLKLQESIEYDLTSVDCYIALDEEDAINILVRRHFGEQDGIGSKNFDSIEKKRFISKNKGTPDPQLVLYDYIDQYKIYPLTKNKFSIALFERIYTQLIEFLKLEVKGNELFTNSYPINSVDKALQQIFNKLEKHNTRTLNDKDDIKKFLNENKNLLPNQSDQIATPQILNSSVRKIVDKQSSKPKIKPIIKPIKQRQDRLYLIDFGLSIDNPRINNIYRELKSSIKVEDAPNACAVLMRVFIELSCDHYAKTKDVKDYTSKNNHSLVKKVDILINHMISADKLTTKQGDAIKRLSSIKTSIDSIAELNMLVHSDMINPIASELKTKLDNWAPFIKAIWS